MKNKKNAYIFLYLFLINCVVMYHYTDVWGYRGVEQLVTSFDKEANHFSLFLLVLYMSIAVMFIYTIIKKTNDIFIMAKYILPRSSKKKFMNLLLHEVGRSTIKLAGIKLIVDILFCIWIDSNQLQWLLFLFFLYVTTFFMWGLIIILLALFKIDKGVTQFIAITFVMILQLLSYDNKFISIFVVASINYREDVLFLIASKILLLLILFWYLRKTVYKYEIYGGEKV
ncbi:MULTISPECIES: hypothetical protein [unclassified Virgibacillus]|uniref:hypothetical protein n=1 Tax=unclassified Virgibacillus TaxID=2620237 RepID=UPI0024DE85E4|nr:hypothetical protein [Virgibacillus sp. LDC-1]